MTPFYALSPSRWLPLLLLAALAMPAGAVTITVTTLADGAAADGACSLREAVQAANTDAAVDGCAAGSGADTVVFSPGLGAGTLTLTDGALAVTAALTVNGATSPSTVVTIDAGGSSRVFRVDGAGTFSLRDLTLTNGSADQGGAVFLGEGTDATFLRVTITASTAATNGGAIYQTAGALTLDRSTLSGNTANGATAGQGGGALYTAGGTATLRDVTLSMNAAAGAAGSGGALLVGGGTATVTDGTLSGNTANRAGGAVEVSAGGAITLTESTMADNDAGTSPGNGGALHLSGASQATVRGGTVSGNTAVEGGGLWAAGPSTLTVELGPEQVQVLLSDNTATGDAADQGGGAIYNDGGTVDVSNAQIVNNAATGASGSGGGLLNNEGRLTVRSVAFRGNTANRAGGGLEDVSGPDTRLSSVFFLDNTAGTAPGNGGGLHGGGSAVITYSRGRTEGNTAVEGGGLWISGAGTLTVTDVIVRGNTATGADADQGGGGLYNDGGTLVLNRTFVRGNAATGASGSGGGILSKGGALTVTGGEIDQNTSSRAGGGIEVNAATAPATATLTDVMITANDAGTSPGNGGGVHTGGAATLTVDGVTFRENTAVEGGGLWINGGGVLDLQGTSFESNVATGDAADQGGGGFYNDGGEATLTDAWFFANHAAGTSGSGGGIFNNMGMLTVRESMFDQNTSNRAGGAVEDRAGATARGAMVQITASTMQNNDAGANPGNGGALHITGAGRVRIDSTDVRGNQAANEGGGLWNSGLGVLEVSDLNVDRNAADEGGGLYQQGGAEGLTIVRRSLLSNNTAVTLGGGVASGASMGTNETLLLINSTLSGNAAASGGGLGTAGTRVFLSNVTVADNEATVAGGGLFNTDATGAPVASPDNTIVGDNTAPVGPDLAGAFMSRGYNLFETTTGATLTMSSSAGPDLTGVDPMLGPLANNGGRTWTHALLTGSPAIDAGMTVLTVDQRGFPREANDGDIGAFEFGANAVASEGDPETGLEPGEALRLDAVRPNPLRDGGEVRFTVRDPQAVEVHLFDTMGRRVQTLYAGTPAPGATVSVGLDARGLASGVYVLVVQGETVRTSRPVTIAR